MKSIIHKILILNLLLSFTAFGFNQSCKTMTMKNSEMLEDHSCCENKDSNQSLNFGQTSLQSNDTFYCDCPSLLFNGSSSFELSAQNNVFVNRINYFEFELVYSKLILNSNNYQRGPPSYEKWPTFLILESILI